MSRIMPPPSAVIMPSVTTPTMSSLATRIAVIAPFTANANVPARSKINSTSASVNTADHITLVPMPDWFPSNAAEVVASRRCGSSS